MTSGKRGVNPTPVTAHDVYRTTTSTCHKRSNYDTTVPSPSPRIRDPSRCWNRSSRVINGRPHTTHMLFCSLGDGPLLLSYCCSSSCDPLSGGGCICFAWRPTPLHDTTPNRTAHYPRLFTTLDSTHYCRYSTVLRATTVHSGCFSSGHFVFTPAVCERHTLEHRRMTSDGTPRRRSISKCPQHVLTARTHCTSRAAYTPSPTQKDEQP